MKLKELIQKLQDYQEQGYGNEEVYFIQGFFFTSPIESVSLSKEEGIFMPVGIILEAYLQQGEQYEWMN